MSGVTTIKISTEARDDAATLSGEAGSARAFVEELIRKYKDGELVEAGSVTDQENAPISPDSDIKDLKNDVGKLNMMIKVIGLGLFEENEGISNALNFISNELGNCPSCNVKMTCPNCGCYVSDHLLPEEEDEE